mmetsp:Transcript_22607/g.47178  ORF Transcript_22607/g.47178 Transcript_22607/m.47178 type:complete len:80 (+) Transcript_22607:291-530(+)
MVLSLRLWHVHRLLFSDDDPLDSSNKSSYEESPQAIIIHQSRHVQQLFINSNINKLYMVTLSRDTPLAVPLLDFPLILF